MQPNEHARPAQKLMSGAALIKKCSQKQPLKAMLDQLDLYYLQKMKASLQINCRIPTKIKVVMS